MASYKELRDKILEGSREVGLQLLRRDGQYQWLFRTTHRSIRMTIAATPKRPILNHLFTELIFVSNIHLVFLPTCILFPLWVHPESYTRSLYNASLRIVGFCSPIVHIQGNPQHLGRARWKIKKTSLSYFEGNTRTYACLNYKGDVENTAILVSV